MHFVKVFRIVSGKNIRLIFICLALSTGLNVGVAMYEVSRTFKVEPIDKSPEDRINMYLRFLPESSRDVVRTKMLEKVPDILEIMRQIHQERKKVAKILAEDNVDIEAMKATFAHIRELYSQISTISQDVFIEATAALPRDERQRAHDIITNLPKEREGPTAP